MLSVLISAMPWAVLEIMLKAISHAIDHYTLSRCPCKVYTHVYTHAYAHVCEHVHKSVAHLVEVVDISCCQDPPPTCEQCCGDALCLVAGIAADDCERKVGRGTVHKRGTHLFY